MYDTPQRQLGTIILPPDPVSILNARIEPYSIDEQTYRITQTGQQRYLMDGTPRLQSNLQITTVLTSESGDVLVTEGGQVLIDG